ncbi:M28 family metallopeptidase [Acanthopleuribacter pedis]|uniref:M28 family peptidase n=1 Tax=Acanthopleuribacter pedis TaxID=442870 RepID=A0A8J7QFP4_9BACT|nr:M28 family peptidase [Acanthopleuribacter pedis]MBO1317723.1 M28 family peptidase [Acanthopleuribacter pedis]
MEERKKNNRNLTMRAALLVRLVLVAALCSFFALAQQPARFYAQIDIDGIGPASLDRLKANPGFAWWVEMDQILVVLAEAPVLANLGKQQKVTVLRDIPVKPEQLSVLRFDHFRDVGALDAYVLGRGGRFALLQLRSTPPKTHHDGEHKHPLYFDAFQPNRVLAAQSANRVGARKRAVDPAIQALVNQVDGDRWLADVTTLAGWNRHSFGTEIDDARDWLVAQFSQIDGLTVSTEDFDLSGTTLQNVVARIDGTTTPDRWYVIGAHYDSTSNNTSAAAPGAEDNASGTAGVLEMARVLAAMEPESTIIFMCYSGEEQGLHGSQSHVNRLISDNDLDKVQIVLTMDMIGYTNDNDLDVLLETEQRVSWLVNLLETAAFDYTDLRSVVSYNPFGSDHIPYLNAGLDSLLVIENDYTSYPSYHRTTDTIQNVNLAMGRESLKMNVAVMADQIGFPRTRIPAWQPWLIRWRASPDASAPDQVVDRIINVLDFVSMVNDLNTAR